MKHLLDSNTLIEAKNRYYNMNFCPAFWDWISVKNQSSEVLSISMVLDELKKGKDELADWVKDRPEFFIGVEDDDTQASFAIVAQALAGEAHKMKAGALDEFLAGADPWLIAKAMATGANVVTHEKLDYNIKRKFLIPNVCEMFGVKYMNTFELLDKLEAKFILHT